MKEKISYGAAFPTIFLRFGSSHAARSTNSATHAQATCKQSWPWTSLFSAWRHLTSVWLDPWCRTWIWPPNLTHIHNELHTNAFVATVRKSVQCCTYRPTVSH